MGQDLNVIGIIAIILLIGIVKKNGIMRSSTSPCVPRTRAGAGGGGGGAPGLHYQRLRPILMTTACALLGGGARGAGSRAGVGVPPAAGLGDHRRPDGLGRSSPLFTTPVIYFYLGGKVRQPL